MDTAVDNLDRARLPRREPGAQAPTQIELTSRLIDDLGADSLDFIDILFGLE